MQKDPVLAYLIAKAAERAEIHRLILFGSRATNSSNERSDYDIAVSAPTLNHANWSVWADSIREGVPTLCGLDLIWIESVSSDALKSEIAREGKVFYERK